MIVTKAKMNLGDTTLATKCLDFCQALTSQGNTFTFTLHLGSSYSFSLDTRVKMTSPEVIKKKSSLSAMRRNARRKEEFLARKKSETSLKVEASSPVVETFQCDQCAQSFKTKKGLGIHIGKAHMETIPQTDGHTDDITADVAVQTSDVKPKDFKDNGTQTDSPLKKVQDEIRLEPFKLKFKIPEKKHSSDIYESYLEEHMPLNMPKTVLHPFD